jgi:hypothetical protein
MDAGRREGTGMARGPRVGGERHGDIAFRQRRRQRFGRKQMPAGAAGRDQHTGRCGISVRCHGVLLEHFRRYVQRSTAENAVTQCP